ncbi:siderophore-interacting protein [Pacificoceanicola onchidii]|uniref:siderophore-interacting protein n=1 Tax=Pacificoceanicola onchidii TaxID=2562685 RepID=UPI0010A684EC|nr:siderophore-interacting protein [Pacificoceanicola onchidii]
MSVLSNLKTKAKQALGRPSPRVLTVKRAGYLTPNMIRVVFAGPELDGFPEDRNGANCKIMIPDPDESREAFAARLSGGPAPVRRTYTVRGFDPVTREMWIDFVAHGDNGPASRWAMQAKTGDFLGFAGPSGAKVTRFDADWYLVAADPSAIPVAAATLEAMPRDAKGVAIFEVTSAEDKQEIDAPAGIETHWLVHPHPEQPSTAQEELIRALPWPSGRVQTCIAGESAVVRALRAFLHQEKGLPRADTYISGYWKIGLVEDEHQKVKRAEG